MTMSQGPFLRLRRSLPFLKMMSPYTRRRVSFSVLNNQSNSNRNSKFLWGWGQSQSQVRFFSSDPDPDPYTDPEGTEGVAATLNLNVTPLELMQRESPISGGTIFSEWGPVTYTADLFCALKDLTGLSWVPTILLTTACTRLLTGLPTAIAQQRALKRLEDLRPQILQLATDLKKETGYAIKKFGWDEKTAKRQFKKSFKKHWRALLEEHNCHPMKSICLGLMQVPIWICFSSALRNIVFGLPLPRTEESAERWLGMFEEGLPWIERLTATDPLLLLPFLFLTANLLNLYLHSRNRPLPPEGQKVPRIQTALPLIFAGGAVGISIFACFMPSAVVLYWATSSTVALGQNVVLMHPKIREQLKMPVYSSQQPISSDSVSKDLSTSKSN